ncbi:MAG TPA: hypothetical protein VEA80_16970 [Vitreimonas sp.]|uniref:hypothetical protein n=1 Tax=Vitreimonas sp. TaxID=3069702 RepID=UPI002D66EBF7|nr:hypothetical protein [Vitreimonas sp.]HYD89173.1 hypothetical protein [Vitreimonas sp.]
MRTLAAWTTTAAVALLGGAAHAQTPSQNTDLQTAITAYAAYHSDVSELRANTPSNANALETALDRVGRHNRDALTRGWIAYGAQTAAQSPAFVQGVRDAAAYYGRDAVIWAVTVDPSYARGLRGGQEATRMLLESAQADSQRIISVADRYQELAYSIQRQRWANAVAPGQNARVQRIRSLGREGAPAEALPSSVAPRLTVATLSVQPANDPTAYGGRRFWDSVRGGDQVVEVASTPAVATRANVTRAEALDRMAAVAALQALDAIDTNQSAVTRLISDPRSRDCIEMAQLQLYQCMSAARFRYENAFCLGQHGLRDIGTCIGAVGQPDAQAMTPIPAAARGGGRD